MEDTRTRTLEQIQEQELQNRYKNKNSIIDTRTRTLVLIQEQEIYN